MAVNRFDKSGAGLIGSKAAEVLGCGRGVDEIVNLQNGAAPEIFLSNKKIYLGLTEASRIA